MVEALLWLYRYELINFISYDILVYDWYCVKSIFPSDLIPKHNPTTTHRSKGEHRRALGLLSEERCVAREKGQGWCVNACMHVCVVIHVYLCVYVNQPTNESHACMHA